MIISTQKNKGICLYLWNDSQCPRPRFLYKRQEMTADAKENLFWLSHLISLIGSSCPASAPLKPNDHEWNLSPWPVINRTLKGDELLSVFCILDKRIVSPFFAEVLQRNWSNLHFLKRKEKRKQKNTWPICFMAKIGLKRYNKFLMKWGAFFFKNSHC